MTAAAWIVMLAVMGLVWGGLALIVATALRKESGKRAVSAGATAPPQPSERGH